MEHVGRNTCHKSGTPLHVLNPPAMQETQVQSLGRDDPLEEGMATHSSTLAWRIPWTEEPAGLQSVGSHKWDVTEASTQQQQLGRKAQTAHNPGHYSGMNLQ